MSDEDTLHILRRLFLGEDSIANAARLTGAERQALIYARERGWITRNYMLTPNGQAVIKRRFVCTEGERAGRE